jgi:hypothetical protein
MRPAYQAALRANLPKPAPAAETLQ